MPEERRSEPTEKQEKTSSCDKKVENLRCYHGVMNKDEARLMMIKTDVGAFLVRSCFMKTRVALGLILTVKVVKGDEEQCFHHYLINLNPNKRYTLSQDLKAADGTMTTVDSQIFDSVDELIAHFMHHRLACKVRLSSPVNRPWWQIRSVAICFTEAGRLGSGNFCVVYKGTVTVHKKTTEVAIKVSKQEEKNPESVLEMKKMMFAEAKIMMNYRHPHVIRLLGLMCERPPFMVCMEFCAGGSLEDALKKYGKEMTDFERQILLIDAARGMRYLHTQKCVHRDLASRNCLISSEGLVKIADFGLSRTLQAGQDKFKESLKEAPLAWLAPECIQRVSEFSPKTDAWAFGVVIYEVYNNGAKLFAGEEDTTIIRRIKRANMPTIEERTTLTKMHGVLNAIWVRKPEDRPEFQKILEMLIDAFVNVGLEALPKLQINKLHGVTRKTLPNLSTDPDPIASERDDSASDKQRRTRVDRLRRDSSLRKTRKGKRSRDREKEDMHQSSRKVIARTVRENKSE